MFSLTTTFNREDFTRLLIEQFQRAGRDTSTAFFDTARGMNFYDDQATTVGQLFERFFPGREDVIRLLMEPITYANGSTLEDPAITYGIVFSNFMSKGVLHVPRGHRPADRPDAATSWSATASTCGSAATSRRSTSARGRVEGVDGQRPARSTPGAVVSNANLKRTIFKLVGEEHFDRDVRRRGPGRAAEQFEHARSTWRCKPGETIDESMRRPAVQLDRAAVPHRAAAQPRRHQPHLFVLLSAHAARQRPLR